MSVKFTVHTVVKNEEQFIKSALLSVLDYAEELLVWDTGSTDKTVKIIESMKSNKIKFKQCGKVNRKQLVELRNQQLKETKTPWFLLVDGDEIWPKRNLVYLIKAMKKAKKQTIALVNKTRNCISDVYHYSPESEGEYQIGPWEGHLNIRAIRKIDGLQVKGEYPLEAYSLKGKPIQELVSRLEFVDTWYLHATHLKRSGWQHQLRVIDRLKKYKFLGKGKALKMKKEELPEVLYSLADTQSRVA